MTSDLFDKNFNFGETIKNKELCEIIFKEYKRLYYKLKEPEINKSTPKEDMEECIDYRLNFDIPISFRARRISFDRYPSPITLRGTGENGGKAEIYKFINGNCQAKIYVFVWDCGSYAIIDIDKWIESGLIEKRLKRPPIPNKNPKNIFYDFYVKNLNNHNCILCLYDMKRKEYLLLNHFNQQKLGDWL